MKNAREFIEEIATVIRAKGREVTVTETDETFGKFVWLSSLAPTWHGHTLTLSARYSATTKRWSLGELAIDHGSLGTRTTRTMIRIAADVYA